MYVFPFALGFLATSLGSALVFFVKRDIKEETMTLFLGFASGVMIAASVWGLLTPALEESSSLFVPVFSFLLGGAFLVIIDHVIPHMHLDGAVEGPKTRMSRSARLFLAITIHNIPEGLSVGFALGAAFSSSADMSYASALSLAIAIAIQNFPEGASVSLPMLKEKGRAKSFVFGSLSGLAEPVFSLIGFYLAQKLSILQPALLSFSAGAMIYVVAEDLIPDSKIESHPHRGAFSLMLGFALMMCLDVALG